MAFHRGDKLFCSHSILLRDRNEIDIGLRAKCVAVPLCAHTTGIKECSAKLNRGDVEIF